MRKKEVRKKESKAGRKLEEKEDNKKTKINNVVGIIKKLELRNEER